MNQENLQQQINERCPCFAKPLSECDCEGEKKDPLLVERTMKASKVKVVTIINGNEVQITYRDMTPDEIQLGEFFRNFLGTKETSQSRAIVKYGEV